MEKYETPDKLRLLLQILKNKKFVLDCGHRVTFNHFLGNNIVVINGKKLKIVCSDCGY